MKHLLALLAVAITVPSQLNFKADGTGAVTRKVASKLGDVVSVLDFGCIGDGSTDNAVCLQAAIDSLPSSGGTVYVPPGAYRTSVGLVTRTGNKGVHLVGAGMNASIISGTGITIYTVQCDHSSIEDIQIAESNSSGNASTIAVDVFLDFVAGVNWMMMKHVYLQGPNGGAKLGIGLRLRYTLKSTFVGVLSRDWNLGMQIVGQAGAGTNANTFSGLEVHDNNTGWDASSTTSFDGTNAILGGVIGHNNIGVNMGSTTGGTLTITGVHFENNLGSTPQNIVCSGGNIALTGNGFYLGSGNNDVVMSGSCTVASYGDAMSSGVTNNGSGVAYISMPRFSPTSAGSGLITRIFDGDTIVGPAVHNLQISGYNELDVRVPIIDQSGNNLRLAANTGKNIDLTDNTITPLIRVNGGSGQINVYAKINTAGYGIPAIHGTPVLLTGQVADKAATSVYAAAPVGEYRVCATARTTTSGTGTTATLNIIWTDEGGVKTDAVGTWALNSVTVTGQIQKCEYIHAAAATNIQVSTSGGTYGTSVYALSATAERLN